MALSLPAHSSQGQLPAPAPPAESSPELSTEQVTNLHCRARKQTGHSLQFVLCQLAQAHLSAGHSLNTF